VSFLITKVYVPIPELIPAIVSVHVADS